MSRPLTVLGSTGSIGTQTLECLESMDHAYDVYGLACRSAGPLFLQQIRRFRPRRVAVGDSEAGAWLERRLGEGGDPEVLRGEAGLEELSRGRKGGLLIAAIPGTIALLPVLESLRSGQDVGLASKEVLATAGAAVVGEARRHGARLLPLDSELLPLRRALTPAVQSEVDGIVLTASGGPFEARIDVDLEGVTPAQAIRHPRWRMGPKVSVDSATLMNKGLELICARWLFDLPPDRIQVLVHPESVVHALVQWADGSLEAHLAPCDMRLAIRQVLSWPQRLQESVGRLDLANLASLHFREPDDSRFPCLGLARRACERGGNAPAVLNAANEVAVEAFLKGCIPFTRIPELVLETLDAIAHDPVEDLESCLAADRIAREEAARRCRA